MNNKWFKDIFAATKYKVLLFLIVFLVFPVKVKANIACNDGTISSTCTECTAGCCSHHGGCSATQNYTGNNYRKNIKNKIVETNDTDDIDNSDGSEIIMTIIVVSSLVVIIVCENKLKNI